MGRIVVVHGIGQQFKGAYVLRQAELPALLDGLPAGVTIDPDQVAFAFYGDLFRPSSEVLAAEPFYDAEDVTDGFEQELLRAWWARAADVDPQVLPPEVETLARTPRWAQHALLALSRSRFFTAVGERALIGDLKQVRSYFSVDAIRREAQQRVATCVTGQTRVVVGHSLGSVIAYESLCAHPEWSVRALVTLGSPLGLRHLIFDRLEPPPLPVGADRASGVWPGRVATWTNVVDQGDVVAVVEDLRPLFGDAVHQLRVYNGAHAHDIVPYLTDRLTGLAIAEGLNDPKG